MIKNKILALLFSLMFMLTSCGEYQKVLNRGTTDEQYKMAVKLYESQKVLNHQEVTNQNTR